MAGKKGSRFVFVMVLLSSFFLLLSAFGVLPNPVRGAKRFQLDPDRTTGPAAAQPSESGNPQAPGDSQDETEETEILLMELPLYGNDPDSLPAGGNSLRVWPEELSVPILHEPDLKSYLGQTASPEPLRGITVILMPRAAEPTRGPYGVQVPMPSWRKHWFLTWPWRLKKPWRLMARR